MAQQEAAAAFGNGDRAVEKDVEHHAIEFQIWDEHGNVISRQRECSIQRRHQKLPEELRRCR